MHPPDGPALMFSSSDDSKPRILSSISFSGIVSIRVVVVVVNLPLLCSEFIGLKVVMDCIIGFKSVAEARTFIDGASKLMPKLRLGLLALLPKMSILTELESVIGDLSAFGSNGSTLIKPAPLFLRSDWSKVSDLIDGNRTGSEL